LKREYLRLVSAVVSLGGLSVALMNQKVTEYTPVARLVAFLMMVLGAAAYVFLTYGKGVSRPRPVKDGGKAFGSARLINLLGLGRRKVLFPVYGIGLIILVFAYNYRMGNPLDLQGFDGATIVLGVLFILYDRIPKDFRLERDFALLLFLFVFVLLVAPLKLYRILSGDPDEGSTPFAGTLIVQPLSMMLDLLGINNSASGPILSFMDSNGQWQKVIVAFACSGMYSTIIFISAFLALVLVEYKRYNLKVVAILVLGVVTAYLANMLRMVVLVLMGYYNGMGNSKDPEFGTLLWGHAYLGEIIFISWVMIFWALLYKYMIGPELDAQRKDSRKKRKVRKVRKTVKASVKERSTADPEEGVDDDEDDDEGGGIDGDAPLDDL